MDLAPGAELGHKVLVSSKVILQEKKKFKVWKVCPQHSILIRGKTSYKESGSVSRKTRSRGGEARKLQGRVIDTGGWEAYCDGGDQVETKGEGLTFSLKEITGLLRNFPRCGIKKE